MIFEPGHQIELVYPTITHVTKVDRSPRMVRQLYIHRVRDLVENPLTLAEYIRRPFVARSRWLILASEWASQPPKQFYLGSADNFKSPGILRLALFEENHRRPAKLLGRQFEPTIEDRKSLMRLALREFDKHEGYELRIIASDLRVIT